MVVTRRVDLSFGLGTLAGVEVRGSLAGFDAARAVAPRDPCAAVAVRRVVLAFGVLEDVAAREALPGRDLDLRPLCAFLAG